MNNFPFMMRCLLPMLVLFACLIPPAMADDCPGPPPCLYTQEEWDEMQLRSQFTVTPMIQSAEIYDPNGSFSSTLDDDLLVDDDVFSVNIVGFQRIDDTNAESSTYDEYENNLYTISTRLVSLTVEEAYSLEVDTTSHLTVLPEPGTAALLGIGVASLSTASRRRRQVGL